MIEKPNISQNDQEGKRQNITVEVNGVKIEGTKYYFEYPEKIQKETGILGYDRTIISEELFEKYAFEIFKNLMNKRYQINLESFGITNYDGIIDLQKNARLILDQREQKVREQVSEPFSQLLKFDDGNLREIEYTTSKVEYFNKTLNGILNNLSDGEYPNKLTDVLFQNTIDNIVLSLESKFQFSLKKHIYLYKYSPQYNDILFERLMEYINHVYKKFINMYDSNLETNIPIFINNDEVPQLSWGHAKYAHYFDEKGFNYFEFKHADHLPVKELGSFASK